MGDGGYSTYVNIRDAILLDARSACDERAQALGFTNNNCITAIPDTDDIFSNGNSGECHYEELAADTDGMDTDDRPPSPLDLTGLSCDAGVCRAPQSLIDDMMARPEVFLLDDTRVEIDPSGLLTFRNVSPGDVAYTVGPRSGKTLLKIDGEDATSMEAVADLLVTLDNSSSATIEIKDVYGSIVTLSVSVY